MTALVDKTPEELELAALSALRTPEQVFDAVERGVEDLSFQVPEHERAWRYVVERAAAGKPASRGDLEVICGVKLLVDVEDAETLVDALVERATARRTIQAIYARADELNAHPRSGLRALLGDLGEISASGGAAHQVRFDSGGQKRLERLRQRLAAIKDGVPLGIPTGLPLFDEQGDTWKPGELVSIIGATNVGKSFFALWLTANAYLWGASALYLSPESTTEDVEDRLDPLLAHRLGFAVSNRALRNGKQDAEEYERYLAVLAERRLPALTIRDTGDQGVFTARDIVAEARRYRPAVLVIDGFHLIRGEGKSWESMQEAAKAVKGAAQSLGMVVLAVSQAQRNATLAADDAPELGQAAYGLALMEASNRVISLAEKRGDEAQRVFKVPKNRDGARHKKRQYLRFDVDRGDIAQLVPREHDDGLVDL